MQHGGGIFNVINENETFVLSNSTISNNSANINGGGIVNYGDGTLDFQNNTITYNSGNVGGGIYSYSAGVFSVKNNIIAHNVGGDCFNDFGTITDVGYNIMGDGSCDFTDGSDPMLGPLQDNGGATFTHALLPGSPAIDAGDTNLTIDQRGVTRPQGSADDIGAYEVVHYNTLTIFKNGTGSVTSIPYGIDCGSTCDNDFVSGIVVTLTASSNSNAIFTGWEGAGCIGIGDCVLTMESNKVVTATFQSYYPVYLPITIKD